MAVLNSTNATEGVNFLSGSQFLFDTADGIGFSTSFSWLTPGGDDVQVNGFGFTYSGGVPTGGTVTSMEFDLNNDDFLTPDYTVTGMSADLTQLVSTGALGLDFLNATFGANDTLNGSNFNDTLKGVAGNDSILGNGGNDNLSGGIGNDTLRGGIGNDSIFGGADNDSLFGDGGDDTLNGDAGNDVLSGGTGSNVMNGGAGNDTITEGGADIGNGGTGNDLIVITSSLISSADSWDGGDDIDTLDMSGISLTGSRINLFSGNWTSSTGAVEAITNFENLRATQGNDSVIGTNGINLIIGNAGNDTIESFGGNDTVEGNAGADVIDAGSGNDLIRAFISDIGTGNDTIDGNTGYDTFIAMNEGSFNFAGWSFSNMEEIEFRGLLGITGTTMIFTGAQMSGFASNLVIDGNGNSGTDDELIINDVSSLDMSGWTFAGFNNITGDDSAILVNGSGFNNSFTGSVMSDRINGGLGNDDFILDIATYHLGNDTLNGEGGNDELLIVSSGTYLLNENLQVSFMEEIDFAESGGTTTFNLAAREIDQTAEFAADTTVFGSTDTDILNFDLVSNEFFDISGWIINLTAGIDAINYINGGASTSNITSTDFGESFDTGEGNAVINSRGGDDVIQTGSGADLIDAGTGNDIVQQSEGNDTIDGGTGNDTLKGGGGNDSIIGGDDNDLLVDNNSIGLTQGSAGNDTLRGGNGDDTFVVNDGNDLIDFGVGNDTLFIDATNAGALTLTGNLGSEDRVIFTGSTAITSSVSIFSGAGMTISLSGIRDVETGSGNDIISEGNLDKLDLNGGDDRFIGIIDVGIDEVDGGSGNDTYEYTSSFAQTIDLEAGTVNGVAGALVNFENFIGFSGGGNDTVTAASSGSVLSGMAGDDSLTGGTGSDTINGGAGDDMIRGGTGSDRYEFAFSTSDQDTITESGGGGTDTLAISDRDADDLNFRRSGTILVIEENGNADRIVIEDHFSGVPTERIELVEAKDGTYFLKSDNVGTNTNDILVGASPAEVLNGSGGRDLIFGGGGNDTLNGGAGDDNVRGGTGSDRYEFSFNSSDQDTITEVGGNGTDTLAISDRDADDLNFRRSGTILVVEEEGNADRVVIVDHFSGVPTDRIELVAATDGTYFLKSDNIGTNTNDILVGASPAEVLNGAGGRDLIFGGGGEDTINGGAGDDLITGGGAKDALTGSLGADVFVFRSVSDSTAAAAGRDTIYDFVAGIDRIDLSVIDADITSYANNAFVFSGLGATAGAGTLAYSAAGGNTLIQADVDGGGADFSILLAGNITLTAGDFIL